VQSPSELDKGLPLKIKSPDLSLFIPNGSPVSISFFLTPIIGVSPLEWTAVAGLAEGTLVKVCYQNKITGSFSIHRVRENTYKLLFCTLGSNLCGNVALVKDEAGDMLLAVNQKEAYEFVLEELKSSSAASKLCL